MLDWEALGLNVHYLFDSTDIAFPCFAYFRTAHTNLDEHDLGPTAYTAPR